MLVVLLSFKMSADTEGKGKGGGRTKGMDISVEAEEKL